MSKFNFIGYKLPLIYTNLYLKRVFENRIVSSKQSIRSVVNSVSGSVRDKPKMCLRHPPFIGRNKVCSR